MAGNDRETLAIHNGQPVFDEPRAIDFCQRFSHGHESGLELGGEVFHSKQARELVPFFGFFFAAAFEELEGFAA